ncbi:MAG TPA: glycosyltransferase [Solirubrobacteraceae bacterium]|nr:glycosyltransferase [Solirubrobacteraceae bacterium]
MSAAHASQGDGSGAGRDRRPQGPIVCFATQGQGHIEGLRIRLLLADLDPHDYPFDHAHKLRSAIGLLRLVAARRPRLLVMEGTGTGGGLTLLLARALFGTPYVVSSGDAVGPYLRLRSPIAGWVGGVYERLLYRRCAGFIGWTPYLVGRALTYGAPRGMTAAGWTRAEPAPDARARVRATLGVGDEVLLIGLTGSIHKRREYVYGSELVRAVRRSGRRDVAVLVIGDGSGLELLRQEAGEDLGTRILLPGRVAPDDVPDHLAACDLASLSQSTDEVGAFRYTTKLSEYLAVGLPVITAETPLAYDLDEGYLWRLPGFAPWDPRYIDALVALLDGLTREDVRTRAEAVARRRADPFDRSQQQRRAAAFVSDLLA